MNRRRAIWTLGSIPFFATAPAMLRAREARTKIERLEKSDDEWRKLLPEDRFQVLFREATEPAGSSPLNDEKRKGTYVCAACKLPLFESAHKFDSGTGWPSFTQPIEGSIGTKQDYKLILPGGETKTILSVPNYDFNWQTYYMFKEPLLVPRGSKIVSTAWYDNSAGNKSNPDPKVDVKWGDQTWEEMQYTGILFSPVQTATAAPAEPARER